MKDVIIIGGGPAGMMSAYQLDMANIDYLLIEKNHILGKKLLITGQGRCNVTNHLNTTQFIEQLTVAHRKFMYSALSNFGSKEVISFFEQHNVPLYQDGDLKYFPKSNKAIDIRDVFSKVIHKCTVFNTEVLSIDHNRYFEIITKDKKYYARNVIVATGSKSFPTTGSTGMGNQFAKMLQVNAKAFYPAETSLYSNFVKQNKQVLQGITIPQSTIRIQGTKIVKKGDLLFTHFGLSGPSIFHLSEFMYHEHKKGNQVIEIAFSNHNENQVRHALETIDQKIFILKFLEQYTIKRIAKFILSYLNINNVQIGMISSNLKNKILDCLFRFPIKIDRVEDLEKAYVNGGGIDTLELHPKSFQVKKIDGLYCIGEAIDVHGPIGGFNITMALSMGYAASRDLIEKIK